ncbi:MAG: hypothetical protein HYY55_01925 [Candidatus Niyogibacteria bacterium]|nr:MAG: hypothetical protein HYY55_01925 [Candidatus Niyogibacteria bacterium]
MSEKGKIGLSEASALLDLVIGAQGSADEIFDLSKLPRKMMEIERKYWLTPNGENTDLVITDFITRFGERLKHCGITVERFTPFVGVDQYYIMERGGDEFIFRYRVGANRSPQLTVKFQLNKGSNMVRGELNLSVKYEDPEKIGAFLAVIAALADSCKIFTVQQSGNIWITKSPAGNLVEVVVYRTARISPPERLEVFVEVEPLNSDKIDRAVATIDEYEKELQLGGLLCEKSIAEIFR